MDYEFPLGAPQGWQCPICKRVYSQTTPFCYYCGGGNRASTTTTPNEIEITYTVTSAGTEYKPTEEGGGIVNPSFVPDYMKDPLEDSHVGMFPEG